MKKLLLITGLVLTVSCSKEDEGCGCVKNVSERVTYIYVDGTLPKTGFRKEFKYSEDAGCQDPINFVDMGNGLSYEIKCD